MFYEEWSPVIESKISKSSTVADGIDTDSLLPAKSSAVADDLERFLNLSFSHHIIILAEEKNIEKRWKYISLAIEKVVFRMFADCWGRMQTIEP